MATLQTDQGPKQIIVPGRNSGYDSTAALNPPGIVYQETLIWDIDATTLRPTSVRHELTF